MSLVKPCLSITAPTKIGPFIAFDAAINSPSGDQLENISRIDVSFLKIASKTPGTHLRRRKKVLPGEFLNGFDTVSTHDQS